MVEHVRDDGTGLVDLMGMSLRQLAELDGAVLDGVTDRLVGAAGSGDRLWNIGDRCDQG